MADRTKFEQMLELLINEDKRAAEELFHEIVVEKSRDIYESLLSEEDEDDSVDEAEEEDDDSVDEAEEEDMDESEDDLDESFNLDEFEVEADPMGGDATDDMEGDIQFGDDEMGDETDDMGMGMDGEEDLEDRVDDLTRELEQLKTEFEKLMAGEEGEPEHAGMFGDEEDEEGEEGDEGDEDMFGADDEEEMPSKESFTYEAKKVAAKKVEKKDEKKPAKKSAGEEMREYVEKVGGAQYHQYGKMGDNGANAKSIVAGKNDMGGTTANILASKSGEAGVEANKGHLKGSSLFKGTPKDMNTKNVNVPGSKTATKLSSVAKGHGAEKKGAGETADKSAGSMLNGAPRRAK